MCIAMRIHLCCYSPFPGVVKLLLCVNLKLGITCANSNMHHLDCGSSSSKLRTQKNIGWDWYPGPNSQKEKKVFSIHDPRKGAWERPSGPKSRARGFGTQIPSRKLGRTIGDPGPEQRGGESPFGTQVPSRGLWRSHSAPRSRAGWVWEEPFGPKSRVKGWGKPIHPGPEQGGWRQVQQ